MAKNWEKIDFKSYCVYCNKEIKFKRRERLTELISGAHYVRCPICEKKVYLYQDEDCNNETKS